jgi:hypothetical protein
MLPKCCASMINFFSKKPLSHYETEVFMCKVVFMRLTYDNAVSAPYFLSYFFYQLKLCPLLFFRELVANFA